MPDELFAKEHRSYFMWEYGKAPDAVVEVVSNREGGETTDKMLKYAQIGIPYYAIHDPELLVQREPLRVFVLRERTYQPCDPDWLPIVGLGLTLWQGVFENCETTWLRWCNRERRVIATGAEQAQQERERADQAQLLADRLAARLRELGANPETP